MMSVTICLFYGVFVGNIGTFTKYRGKNSLDDVARVYRVPKWDVDKVKELIVDPDARKVRYLEVGLNRATPSNAEYLSGTNERPAASLAAALKDARP